MIYKVACLGAGYFSQFHRDGWQRLPNTEIVGVCDLDSERARETGHPAFPDLGALLEKTQPDILDIVVPPSAHADAIEMALAHDVKVIICQKPFCLSLDVAEDITKRAAAQGTVLVIHENFRFQPWYRTIKAAISAGDIGTPLQATFRLRPGDGQGPDAYLARQPYFQKMPRFLVHETGVHFIDTFRYLFGDPTAVYADLRKVNPVIAGEDAGIITFDHPGGVRTILDANRNLDHAAENTRCTMGEGLFEGTGGTLTLQGDGSVWLRRFGAIKGEMLQPPDTSETFGGDCTYLLQKHVLGFLSKLVPLENAAESYLNVLHIEDAIYRSAQNGRKVFMYGHK